MLDIGWQEFVLVSFVLLIVIGPKDLPKVLKTIVNFAKKIKSMAYEFQSSVNEIANESELSELRKEVSDLKNTKSLKSTKREIDSLKEINEDTKKIVKKTVTSATHTK